MHAQGSTSGGCDDPHGACGSAARRQLAFHAPDVRINRCLSCQGMNSQELLWAGQYLWHLITVAVLGF